MTEADRIVREREFATRWAHEVAVVVLEFAGVHVGMRERRQMVETAFSRVSMTTTAPSATTS